MGISIKSSSIKMSALILSLAFLLVSCGGSSTNSSSSDDASIEIPVDVTISNELLTGGVPSTFTYTIPKPDTPITDVTIDLVKTLEAATITVTP